MKIWNGHMTQFSRLRQEGGKPIIHSSTHAWRIPWAGGAWYLCSVGHKSQAHNWRRYSAFTSMPGKEVITLAGVLAWENPRTESLVGLQSLRCTSQVWRQHNSSAKTWAHLLGNLSNVLFSFKKKKDQEETSSFFLYIDVVISKVWWLSWVAFLVSSLVWTRKHTQSRANPRDVAEGTEVCLLLHWTI